ncbi:MAG: sugar-binding domain-containing protein [Pseudomonadota bacterium]
MARNGGQIADTRDLAARAAWLSLVGGLTQDQIAFELGISRQRAQRLVARAYAEKLVRVRIDHPIAECLEREQALKAEYGLESAWVSPSLGPSVDVLTGLAPFAASILEQVFRNGQGQVFALGTGRTLQQVVESISTMDGARHRLVSLIGNVAPDGSASLYEVIVRLAEKLAAPHFPLSIPLISPSLEVSGLYRSLPHVRKARQLAESADLAIVGIGQMTKDAPLFVDGFITEEERQDLVAAGAIGELSGHTFNAKGEFVDHPMNQRIVGVRVPVNDVPVLCIGAGKAKVAPLRAALSGGLIHQLITDEDTARRLLGSG